MSDSNTTASAELTPDLVAAYLLENPDFFNDKPELLLSLTIPHASGRAISLVERQMILLREQNDSLSLENEFIREFAVDNEDKLRKTQRLVLALLEARSLEDVGIALQESLCSDFATDTIRLLLVDSTLPEGNTYNLLNEQGLGVLSPLLQTSLPTCGQLGLEQKTVLFDQQAEEVLSLAVAPLVNGSTLGVLALGSYDEDYFSSGDSTLFLSYTAEVTSRVIARLLDGSSYNE